MEIILKCFGILKLKIFYKSIYFQEDDGLLIFRQSSTCLSYSLRKCQFPFMQNVIFRKKIIKLDVNICFLFNFTLRDGTKIEILRFPNDRVPQISPATVETLIKPDSSIFYALLTERFLKLCRSRLRQDCTSVGANL